jgi:hypothetical protein
MKKVLCELVKKQGKFINKDSEMYELFKFQCPEGVVIRAEFSIPGDHWSLNQIRYIHHLFRIASKDTGESFDDVKYRYKCKLGLCVNYRVVDEVKEHIISFTELDKDDMSYCIAEIERFMTEEGIYF